MFNRSNSFFRQFVEIRLDKLNVKTDTKSCQKRATHTRNKNSNSTNAKNVNESSECVCLLLLPTWKMVQIQLIPESIDFCCLGETQNCSFNETGSENVSFDCQIHPVHDKSV